MTCHNGYKVRNRSNFCRFVNESRDLFKRSQLIQLVHSLTSTAKKDSPPLPVLLFLALLCKFICVLHIVSHVFYNLCGWAIIKAVMAVTGDSCATGNRALIANKHLYVESSPWPPWLSVAHRYSAGLLELGNNKVTDIMSGFVSPHIRSFILAVNC